MPQANSLRSWGLCAVVLAAVALPPGTPARAQSLGLGAPGDQTPVEVLADNGIEWMRDGKRFVARGNASAKRGDTTVYADTLTAHYRETQGGKSELWRLDADGHTRITTPTETATGDNAVYDIDSGVMVLTGKPVSKLVTPDTTITAKTSLEYWNLKRMAVARGDALVVRDQRRLQADTLTAYFADGAKRKTPAKPAKSGTQNSGDLETVDAFGHVVITTKTEVVTGDRGRYNVKTGVATILDNVTLTRGTDSLKGQYAVVNMNSGVSTLYARAPGAKTDKPAQVRGVFVPKKAEPLPGATP